jgi:hypothetical protein
MQILKNHLNNINLNYLLCGLYTLSGNHRFFKKLNFTSHIYIDKNEIDDFYSGNIYDFYTLLDKSTSRRFAFQLIKPFLKKNYLIKTSHIENKIVNIDTIQETILLKRYLKKFKYNYYRYFFCKNVKLNSPTSKEVNMAAIELLFLLLGI